MKKIKANTIKYLESLSDNTPGVYENCTDGKVTLYASCFAAMCYHYLGAIDTFSRSDLNAWAEYILCHQSTDGKYLGPEMTNGRLLSSAHTIDHLSWHLTCHVLPALNILGVSPHYPLSFMEKYLDPDVLVQWLERRNWNEAWLEGNNLLFIGQLLTYMAFEESNTQAMKNSKLLFDWLDEKVDPNTGLWGTGGSANIYAAAYGGYHQLLLYYFWDREIQYKEKLIDTVLSLQHFDGGFASGWGGGSCEDVDCVDILVNLYKLTEYRHVDIEQSLLKAAFAVLRRQTASGGFVYKSDEEFYHMGMEYTYAPPGIANMFSTWFGLHTIALISEIISIPDMESSEYQFNNICSMGWHRKWDAPRQRLNVLNKAQVKVTDIVCRTYFRARNLKRSSRLLSKIYSSMK